MATSKRTPKPTPEKDEPKPSRDDKTLQKHLDSLKHQRDEAMANYQACNGAVQAVEAILKLPHSA